MAAELRRRAEDQQFQLVNNVQVRHQTYTCTRITHLCVSRVCAFVCVCESRYAAVPAGQQRAAETEMGHMRAFVVCVTVRSSMRFDRSLQEDGSVLCSVTRPRLSGETARRNGKPA